MTNRLEALEDWAAGLLGMLEPTSRHKLARCIGQELRRSQQRRIITQKNPDGSKYVPRKLRKFGGKQGRVKRKVKMFQKLRTASFLKVQCDGNTISVGFSGRIARIAKVHQLGLMDRAKRSSNVVKYDSREILGFTAINTQSIRDKLLNYFVPTGQ
ncbi:phage virion morphogenesis protein [Pseudomonas sp. R1-1]|uniref:phage virion morphogenesis protein n=1 Tax=Pseudomonas sp. R1-1 TaxID=1602529 RepID=UPI003DA9B62C